MKTAKQINSPQCGEAWTAYMMGNTNGADAIMEKLCEMLGAKLVTICSKCHEEIETTPWVVYGKEGRYCTYCARALARATKGKRGGKASQAAGSRRATPKRRAG